MCITIYVCMYTYKETDTEHLKILNRRVCVHTYNTYAAYWLNETFNTCKYIQSFIED